MVQSKKTNKGEFKHILKAQDIDYEFEPFWKAVWLSLDWQSYAKISQEFSFPLHIHF